jgi:1-acyl-sn-glycerol-3-phosphate acyltransferase
MKPHLNYLFFRQLSRTVLVPLVRFRAAGLENIPAGGPVILVSNHQSYMDPVLIGCANPRKPVLYMARESLFRWAPFAWFLGQMHVFPVKRGGADRSAWRHFEKLVADGEQVNFYPEGTRSADGKLQRADPGADMLIHRCKGATVIPCRVRGAYKVLNKDKGFQGLHPVSLVFGPPVDLAAEFAQSGGRECYQAIADKVMAAIAAIPPIEGRDDDL